MGIIRMSGLHVQRRALAAMPGTVDGFMTSLCISLMTTQTANLQQKYWDVRVDGAPGGENCLGVRQRLLSGAYRNRAQILSRALPGTAGPILGVSKYRHQRPATNFQATHRLAYGKPVATLPTSELYRMGKLAGIILSIRAFISSIEARYPIATAVRPRLAQRCAYTAFPSNFQFGEADGHASVQNALFILAHALGYAHRETIIYSK